jgi:hypothetical protein
LVRRAFCRPLGACGRVRWRGRGRVALAKRAATIGLPRRSSCVDRYNFFRAISPAPKPWLRA